MKRNRKLAVSLVLVLGLGLSACTAKSTDTQPTAGTQAADTQAEGATTAITTAAESTGTSSSRITEFAVTVASAPETIDPQRNSSVDGAIYEVHLNEGLMKYKWDGSGTEYGLAESHTVSDDGLTWIFKIRENAKWSDGQPVTAHDFEYTWKRLVNPETISPYGLDMGQFIKNGAAIANDEMSPDELGAKALDDRTFEVILSGPCGYFDEVACFPSFMPTRQDMVEAHGDRWATSPDTYITAGPFKLTEFITDASMTMIPNEYYYNRDAIIPTKLTFQFLADEVAMVNAVQSGNVSFSRLIPTEERNTLKNKGLYGIVNVLGTYYVSFNTKAAPYDDPNVRKALALAIDRDYIANVLLEGSYKPATAFVGSGFADVSGEFYQEGRYFSNSDYEANVEEAKKALADAGYPNGEGFPKLEYMTNPTTLHLSIAEAMQAMWKDALNIDVEISQQEWNVFLETRRQHEYTVARNGWIADFNDPMNLLSIFATGGGNNDGQYSNAEYDALLNIALTSNDRAERMEAMHKAEDILLGQDWAMAPIMYYVEEIAVDPALKDWGFTPLGYPFFHTSYLEP